MGATDLGGILEPLPADAAVLRAGPEDESEIRALLVQCGLPVEDLLPGHHVEFFVTRDHLELVAVGGLEVHGDCGLIRSVAVSPSHRSEGRARAMVAAIEACARERGLRALYLLTQTAGDFFAALDYRAIGRELVPDELRASTQFARICPSSAVCMRKASAGETAAG